jgi:hypothetical protein
MLSASTKSESASAHRARSKWRLSQTLRRTVDYRPIEAEDIKYLWAAYKQGAFPDMEPDLEPEQFKQQFQSIVLAKFHAVWTLFGPTRKGFIPVGVVFAAWAPNAAYLIITGIMWLPWATKRNIVECTVGFFNGARKEFSFVGYALPEHKRMYEVCCIHGIMRRVGTSYVAIAGKHAAVFETRAP